MYSLFPAWSQFPNLYKGLGAGAGQGVGIRLNNLWVSWQISAESVTLFLNERTWTCLSHRAESTWALWWAGSRFQLPPWERPLHRTSLPIPATALSCLGSVCRPSSLPISPGPRLTAQALLFQACLPGGAESRESYCLEPSTGGMNSKATEELPLPREEVSPPSRAFSLGHFWEGLALRLNYADCPKAASGDFLVWGSPSPPGPHSPVNSLESTPTS